MQEFLNSLGPVGQILPQILIYVVIIGGMYLLMFRPQQKKKKQEEEMRKAIKIGDEITTIGGIVGRVVSIKDETDAMVIESGSEKIKIKKWAISTVNPS